MRRICALLAVLCGVLLHASAGFAAGELTPLSVRTASGSHNFMVEVADNDQSRAQGLMYRRELADDRGMLFDFKEEKNVSFWMQNTYVSLDMIFIAGDGVVRRVEPRATPLSTRMIDSGSPVRYVLEVPAGIAAKLGITRGSTVEHALIRR
jgi:uncharacterized protein